MLNNREIQLVRKGFEQLIDLEDQATKAFYDNLFRTAPAVRSMFPANLDDQAKKLWAALNLVMRSLDQPANLHAPLQQLGRHHANLGVTPAQYVLVADVLIETIANVIGNEWTTEQAAAWQAALSLVADTMIAGAEDTALEQSA